MNARTPAQVAVDIGAFTDVPAGTTTYVDNDNGDDSTGACQPDPAVQDRAFTHALSGEVIYGTGDSIQRHGGRIRSRFKDYHRQ